MGLRRQWSKKTTEPAEPLLGAMTERQEGGQRVRRGDRAVEELQAAECYHYPTYRQKKTKSFRTAKI